MCEKAVMLSHDCLMYAARHSTDVCGIRCENDRFVSYLPLSHVAAQLVDIFCPLVRNVCVYFAQADALKGSLSRTMREVRPTYFFGVPRVWEKIEDGVQNVLKGMSGRKLELINWSRRVASLKLKSDFGDMPPPPPSSSSPPTASTASSSNSGGVNSSSSFHPTFDLVKGIVLKRIYKELGLNKCRCFMSGAAPIKKDTLEFFHSIGMPLTETFGLSESTGPHSIGTPSLNRVSSSGRSGALNRSKLIAQPQQAASTQGGGGGGGGGGGSEAPHGELAIFGRHVFMGYLNEPDKTNESFDAHGWLRTGDLGRIDPDGFIYITGRLKELIITAGGENIAPVPIEDTFKSELAQLVSNCMLVGDKRKYLVMLVTLKVGWLVGWLIQAQCERFELLLFDHLCLYSM